jgi:hypothetical protein
MARAPVIAIEVTGGSTFWTSPGLPLSAPPYSLSHTAIGLFGTRAAVQVPGPIVAAAAHHRRRPLSNVFILGNDLDDAMIAIGVVWPDA